MKRMTRMTRWMNGLIYKKGLGNLGVITVVGRCKALRGIHLGLYNRMAFRLFLDSGLI